MKITIDRTEETLLESNLDSIKEWWQLWTTQIYQKDRLIYCVNIDGQAMYAGYEDYIYNHFKDIHKIDIETKSKQESYEETVLVIKEYLDKLMPACHVLADYFYTELNEERWGQFSQFIEGLNWLIHAFEFMQVLNPEVDLNLVIVKFKEIITEMNDGLESNDMVLVGDLIQYEIPAVLETFLDMDI